MMRLEEMTKNEMVELLRRDVERWNEKRDKEKKYVNPDNFVFSVAEPDLSEVSIMGISRADLRRANLRGADLIQANLSEAYLIGANMEKAYLSEANLSGAKTG